MSSQNVQITFSGEVSGSPISVVGSPAPGDNIIIVSDASTLNVGDIIQLYAEYPPLENRGLAWGDCRIYGQFLKIIDKNGETLMLDMKIGLPYDSSYKPKVQKYNMLSNIGFEKIKIIRDNQTDDEKKSNVYFRYVYNSFISDNEMKYAPRNHIGINNSKDIVVERNYLHDTFITNAGGSGYGVLVIASTGCRITDNKTANLRHHIILHTGANHNVVSYNSLEPSYYSYNDLSLHAVYPYMNLIEGNTFYEGYADNSKESTGVEESSGPYNTWFRNFSVGVGILQSTTDKQNILGNYLGIVLDLWVWIII